MAEPGKAPVEHRDISPRLVWALGAGFAAFVAASAVGLLAFFDVGPSWTFHRLAKPEPVLQIAPADDYREFLAAKRSELAEYGWRDAPAGLLEIPVEEAMRLVSQGHRAEAEAAGDCTDAACRGRRAATGAAR